MRRTHRPGSQTGQKFLAAAFALLCNLHSAAAAPPIRLLILGDSLTAGYGLPLQDGFQAKLSAALKAKGDNVTLVDGAVSGDTTADAAARLDWVLAGGPIDAALVELGGNDALRALDPATTQRNLTYILNTLQAHHIPVLLTGMIAPATMGTTYSTQFTAVFTALSKRPHLIYDPFFLAGLQNHPNLAQPDGLHPNAAGVDYEVTRIMPSVQALTAEVKQGQGGFAPPDPPAKAEPLQAASGQ